MVAAGIVLDTVQHWRLFQHVSELIILIPALLGLKGNLEMTLASRLSTAGNLGELDHASTRAPLLVGSMMLIMTQASVVAITAGLFSILMGVVVHQEFSFADSSLIIAASTLTATVASGILGYTEFCEV